MFAYISNTLKFYNSILYFEYTGTCTASNFSMRLLAVTWHFVYTVTQCIPISIRIRYRKLRGHGAADR